MRIIAGEKRGTMLLGPDIKDIRPTTDRAKESLFNIINNKIIDCTFLDLFAGSGAIGLEAKSRSAKEVICVDSSLASKELINKNISKTNLNINFIYKDVLQFLKTCNSKFDLIFLDPPFLYEDSSIIELVNTIYANNLLNEDGYIIIERQFKKENKKIFEIYNNVDIRKYGKVSFIFIGK